MSLAQYDSCVYQNIKRAWRYIFGCFQKHCLFFLCYR